MAKIRETINFGNRDEIDLEKLLLIIEESYKDLAIAVNGKVDLVERTTDGQTSDNFLSNGTININTSTDNVEIITNHSADGTTVTWTAI